MDDDHVAMQNLYHALQQNFVRAVDLFESVGSPRCRAEIAELTIAPSTPHSRVAKFHSDQIECDRQGTPTQQPTHVDAVITAGTCYRRRSIRLPSVPFFAVVVVFLCRLG